MSQANEEKKVSSDETRIRVGENGEVIINDSELANAVENLSDEELDEIAGGGNGTCPTTNTGCGIKPN